VSEFVGIDRYPVFALCVYMCLHYVHVYACMRVSMLYVYVYVYVYVCMCMCMCSAV
jgi:hypothetical protein